jgi:hypothetical protein
MCRHVTLIAAADAPVAIVYLVPEEASSIRSVFLGWAGNLHYREEGIVE